MKTLLFKPFEKYSEKILLTAGIVFTIIGSLLGFWMNARFDGVLDLHFGKNVGLREPFFDNLINVFSLAILLFFLAKYLNKKTRFVDILTTVMIARTPFYLLSLININGNMSEMAEQFLSIMNPEVTNSQNINIQEIMTVAMENGFLLAIFSILIILCVIWYIALLYNGFKTASHAKGIKPIVLFSITLIFAEIISKILIYNLY